MQEHQDQGGSEFQNYGKSEYQDFGGALPPGAALPKRGPSKLLWFMGIGCSVIMAGCGSLAAFIMYVGAAGPDTAVYTGNQLPRKFRDAAEEVGAVQAGDEIQYFYSDALVDVRNGFYLVSEQHVAIYLEEATTPLTIVPFAEIAEVLLLRDESFFEDSHVTLVLTSDELVSFPLSSEYEHDVHFVDYVKSMMPQNDVEADTVEQLEPDATDPAAEDGDEVEDADLTSPEEANAD